LNSDIPSPSLSKKVKVNAYEDVESTSLTSISDTTTPASSAQPTLVSGSNESSLATLPVGSFNDTAPATSSAEANAL
jgi:hypothetical protein